MTTPVPPTILKREETRLSAWTTLMARTIMIPGREKPEQYHSLRQDDYVLVLAQTVDGKIPLVRQYRAALEEFTLEFPAGLRDGNEAPEETALRELIEEVGLSPIEPMRPM